MSFNEETTEHRRAEDRGQWVPTPDPTQRTIEVLEREVRSIHEKLDTTTDALSDKLRAAMEHRADLTDSKFDAVGMRFDLIEAARVEQKRDSLDSLAAALSAAKEAVKEQTNASDKSISKSENSTTEAIKQLSVTFTAAIAAVERAVSDLKERVVSLETARQGDPMRERIVAVESQKVGAKDSTATLYASLAAFVGVIAIVISAMALFAK